MPASTASGKRAAPKTSAKSAASAAVLPAASTTPPPPPPSSTLPPPSTPPTSPPPPTIPGLQQPSLSMLPARLIAAKKNMEFTGFYLGGDAFRKNVHWVQDGKAHRLAIKSSEDEDAAEAVEVKAHVASDASSYPTPPPDEFEVAPLCAVVQISNRDFWLTSDAGYRGPSEYCKELSSVKPSCVAEQPDVAPFKADYSTVIDNLLWLQNEVATHGSSAIKGLFAQASERGRRFKVRHKLFDVKGEHTTSSNEEVGDNLVGAEEDADENDENAVFRIQNWPTSNDVAASALEDIKATHSVVPVPAYGMDGKLIKPQSYRRQLEGALVELYFGLSHWSIGGRRGAPGNDTYTADIVMIRVLAAPNSTGTTTPRKRKAVDLYIDPSSPVRKKLRRA